MIDGNGDEFIFFWGFRRSAGVVPLTHGGHDIQTTSAACREVRVLDPHRQRVERAAEDLG